MQSSWSYEVILMAKSYEFYCVTSWTTCKKANVWLEEQKIPFNYHDLLKEPLQLAELQALAAQSGATIKELVNTKSQAYKNLQPDLANMDEDAVFELVSSNPRILVRPLLSNGKQMATGFKEEQYRKFLKI